MGMEANTQKLVCVMDTLTTKKVKTMIETKNLEWMVKHPKLVVEHGTFLDNYPGIDDDNSSRNTFETVQIDGGK